MLGLIPKILLCFLPIVLGGLSDDVIEFSIDYFNKDRIKYVCLLVCNVKETVWTYKFSKTAGNNSMKVSSIFIDNDTDYDHVEKCLRHQYTLVGVVIDPDCKRFEDVLTMASQSKWMDSRHKWVIPSNNESFKMVNNNVTIGYSQMLDANNEDKKFFNVKRVLVNMNLSIDADVAILADTCFSCYDIYEAFSFGKIQGGDLIVSKVGNWSKEGGLSKVFSDFKYYHRWDFSQLTMRMSVVITITPERLDPELIIGRRLGPGVAIVTQTAATVLHIIAEIHNFRYNYTILETWIGQFEKNISRSVASGLYFEEQDISPLIRYLPGIFEHIDLAHPPITFIGTKFYYRIPTRGPGKLENQFLTPFSNGAWGCIVAVILLCFTALLLSARAESEPAWIQYAVFSVLATLCQQGFEDGASMRNSSAAGKLTILITGLSCVLFYNYYTSSVVSWLLSGPPPSINSLKELMDSPLELIMEDIGFSRSWVKLPGYYYFNKRNAELEDELRQKKIYNKKRETSIYKSVEEGIDMVKAGGYVFHSSSDTANDMISKKFTQQELCELGSLQSMEKAYLFVGLQKNSPFKEFFVWSLARLRERGVFSCVDRRTRIVPVKCEGSSPRALALGGAAPAFLMLAAGYLLAVAVLLAERFHNLRTTRRLH